MPNVEIFCSPLCGACEEAKEYFRGRGIEYTCREVRWDPQADDWADSENAQRMKQLCDNADFVPQILINGQHVNGWRALKELIQNGKIDTLIATHPSSP